MDSGSDEDIDIGDVEIFEDDLEVNEFAETLELIELNADEIDAQVLDAITRQVLIVNLHITIQPLHITLLPDY